MHEKNEEIHKNEERHEKYEGLTFDFFAV